MSMSFEDTKKPKDWSVIILWWSIILSALIVTGTLAWHMGKQWKIESYLKRYGIKTCKDLHRPYGANGPRKTDLADEYCEKLVKKKHSDCIKETSASKTNLKMRRQIYVTCFISGVPSNAAGLRTDNRP